VFDAPNIYYARFRQLRYDFSFMYVVSLKHGILYDTRLDTLEYLLNACIVRRTLGIRQANAHIVPGALRDACRNFTQAQPTTSLCGR
jgi:hypothetical protein